MNSLLDLTKQLVALNTTTGNKENLSRLQKIFENYGAGIEHKQAASDGAGPDFVISRVGEGSKKILLLGHYDTVPVTAPAKTEGDKLFGTGTYDMKGGLSIALHLFRDTSASIFSEISLLAVGDEEWRENPVRMPGTFDAVLAFEGGNEDNSLVVSRYGAGTLDVVVSGLPLRAELPLAGSSTIESAAKIILGKTQTKAAQYAISSISAQAAKNVVPARVSMSGMVRYRSQADLEELLDLLPRQIGDSNIEITFKELVMPMRSNSAHLVEKAGIRTAERVGASDCSFFQERADLVVDGLGPIGGAEHSPNEYIDIPSLMSQYKQAENLLRHLS